MPVWIWIALAVSVAAVLIYIYNGLVTARQMVAEGWSGILVQLKRRADLVPALIDTVKGYMGHERETLERVTQLRDSARNASDTHPAQRGAAEALLASAVTGLLARAEAYPDLKASANFLELQRELARTEEHIQMSRRYYNGAVRLLNTKVQQFPSNLLARGFGFSVAEYFDLEDRADAALPRVDLGG